MSMSDTDFSADKSPETLEREIEQKRANINNIIGALENKLSPGEIVDTALSFAKGNGGEFISNLGQTIKANPIPTLLTSVGLLWLIRGQNRRPSYDYDTSRSSLSSGLSSASDRVSGLASSASNRVSGVASDVSNSLSSTASDLKHQGAQLKAKGEDLVHRVSDTIGSTRERLSDTAAHASETLRHQAERARNGYDHLLHEQPLVLGAVGIAVGALIGAALPSTKQEDRLLGSTSDKLSQKAKALAEQGYEKAQGLVKNVLDTDSDSGTSASTSTNTAAAGSPGTSSATSSAGASLSGRTDPTKPTAGYSASSPTFTDPAGPNLS